LIASIHWFLLAGFLLAISLKLHSIYVVIVQLLGLQQSTYEKKGNFKISQEIKGNVLKKLT